MFCMIIYDLGRHNDLEIRCVIALYIIKVTLINSLKTFIVH